MAGEDPKYVEFVRSLPCVANGKGCDGPVEAHHSTTGRGMGQRAHDSTCIPLCTYHHRCFHDRSGPFKRVTQKALRQWTERQIAAARSRHAESLRQKYLALRVEEERHWKMALAELWAAVDAALGEGTAQKCLDTWRSQPGR